MQGRTLTNDQIFTAVDCAIQKNLLPYATNAVYLVLGASNIKVNSGVAPPLKDQCKPQDIPHKTAGAASGMSTWKAFYGGGYTSLSSGTSQWFERWMIMLVALYASVCCRPT